MTEAKGVGLPVVLTRHLDRMSRLMTEAKDGYLDLGREVAFFVEVGFHEFLSKDQEFVAAWTLRQEPMRPFPEGMTVQEANYRFDMAILGLASAIYTSEGLLLRKATPHDEPEDV